MAGTTSRRRRAVRQKGRGRKRAASRVSRRRTTQRGRGRSRPKRRRTQRGEGRIKDFFVNTGRKVREGIARILRSKKGKKVARKTASALLKAGVDVVKRGVGPKHALKRRLAKAGMSIGSQLLKSVLSK